MPQGKTTEGTNGMPKVVLSHPSGARAEAYLHGAHVTSWVPAGGEEMLFLSERSRFAPGKAIRGGVPVIFPQFADQGPLPKHGFARTRAWEVEEAEGAAARLVLRDDEAARALWPHPFTAALKVSLGERTLETALGITNTGERPFSFTAALHTYFRVDDVREAAVEGLQGTVYRDKVDDGVERAEDEPAVLFRGETDRIHAAVPGRVLLRGAAGGRTVAIDRDGFPDVVVWNPWAELAAKLDDLGDDDFARMLCVEPACAVTPVTLAPGQAWRGTQTLSIV